MELSRADREVAPGGVFVPDEGTTSRTSNPATKVATNAPFQMVFDPQRWTIVEGKVVPRFYEIRHIPGLQGVEENVDPRTRQRRVRTVHARDDAESMGHRLIPYDAIPDSHRTLHGTADGPKSYLWSPAGRPDVTLLIYTRVFPGNDRVELDHARYHEWVDYLIEREVITPPPSFVLRELLTKKAEERDRVADKARTAPSLAGEVERLSRDVEAIRLELERRERAEGGEAPATGGASVPDEDLTPDTQPPATKPGRAPKAAT
jgi:hypothetical protein